MTPEVAARLLRGARLRDAERAEQAARDRLAETRPDLVLAGETPPGWLARKMGRLYAEPLQDVRDQLLLSVDRVEFGHLEPRARRWAVVRFMAARQAARDRLADLSRYGADKILQLTRK